MRATSIARRYARATFEVARQAGEPQQWQTRLEEMAAVIDDPRLLAVLRSPNFSDSQKLDVFTEAFHGLPKELLNLIRLLLDRHRIEILPGIATAFAECVDDMLGRTDAQVVSARQLSDVELARIQEHLNEKTGKEIRLRSTIDPTLIGGLILRLGDQVIDASVATRLDRLRQKLA